MRFARSCDERLELFQSQGKLLEAQRLDARTRYDVEMMMEMGYCPGIENYSRPLSGRKPRASRRTRCSISFRRTICCSSMNRTRRCRRFGAMYDGDRSRKVTLVEHGFRLPSALDNRPLKFDEWQQADQPGDLRFGDAGHV